MSREKGSAARVKDGPRSRGRAKRQWQVRERVAAPRSSFDELEIHTSDGAVLRALVDDPPEGVALRGTLVLAHALFAGKASFGSRERPGLSSALVARGFRTVAFDFRGHGDSKAPGGTWGYDDLVRHDLPAVVECARARSDDKPVVVLGHALGGHVALASHGTARSVADAIVALGANVWLRDLERSRLRWAAKRAIAETTLAIAARIGNLPARHLRIAREDVPEAALRDLLRVVTDGEWRSRDGVDDYLASLALVTAPVVGVLGERDLLGCHPSAGEAFARRCRGPVTFFRAPVGHSELVESTRARHTVIAAVEWAFAQLRP